VSTRAEEELECDASGLLEMLEQVQDLRKARGKVYRLSFILAVALVATLAGASSFRQVHSQVVDMPQSLPSKYTPGVALRFSPHCETSYWDYSESMVSTRSKKLPSGSAGTGAGRPPTRYLT
jgi:hypothetical protein